MDIHRLYALVNRGFRRRRMEAFMRTFAPTEETTVLDIGGTAYNWSFVTPLPRVTLLNLAPPGDLSAGSSLTFVEGDARALPYGDGAFDIAFSNSVIEHLGTLSDQERFAAEARRVARGLWIETPARSFPVEPHLVAPLVHFLPTRWQRTVIRRATVWGLATKPSPAEVDAFLAEVRLLGRAEFECLFPDCELVVERVAGLAKSYIAVRR